MKLNLTPSELPFSLDLVERCLFWIIVSYFISTLTSWIGFSCCTVFPLLTLLSCISVFIIDRIKVDAKGKAVLITGCDTGFGNAVAKKLHGLGYVVFAACYSKDTDGAKALTKSFPERMFVFAMDVTSDEDANKAAVYIKDHLPQGTELWAVITNAGWSTFGLVEWVPMDVFQKIMNINLFGTIRTVKAVLPMIRRSKGRVITIASMMGRFGAISRAPYCCTKWAVEGFTECLRPELKKWNVNVTCVEPGNFIAGTSLYTGDSSIQKQSEYMWDKLPQAIRDDYGKENFDAFVQKMISYTSNGETSIEPVLTTLCDAVSHTFPQSRYQIFSIEEKIRSFVSTHLPSMIYDYFYNN